MAASIEYQNNQWQVQMKSLSDCGKFLFNNEIMADITFVFNGNKLYAHSWILSMLSPIFYESLKDNFEVKKDIPISFVSYEGFFESLRFIYTTECEISHENIQDIMKVTNKYSLKFLKAECADFIVKSLTVDSASLYLNNAISSEHVDLKNKIVDFIAPNIALILKSESFLNVEKETLEAIIENDEVGPVTEIEIFDGCMKWAEHKCIQNNLAVSGINKRYYMGELIKDIRFTKMTHAEFCQCICNEGELLTAEEIIEIFFNITTNKINKFGFKNDARKCLINNLDDMTDKSIFTGASSSKFNWIEYENFKDMKTRSTFSVNQIIYLTAIWFAESTENVNVCLQIYDNTNHLLFEETNWIEEEIGAKFILKPFKIFANRQYTINIQYENTNNRNFRILSKQKFPLITSDDGEINFNFIEISPLLHGLTFKS